MGDVYRIGVIGAGNMGAGIAQNMAQSGLAVTLVDVTEDALRRGLSIIEKTLNEGLERKIFTSEQVKATLSRIAGTTDFSAVANADLIVEAVFEDKKVKGDVFAKLDKLCAEKTIFATNTSSFYVREFASLTARADRFIGMHYFYHPAKNRLLEVIPHKGTSRKTVEKVLTIAKLHGKTAIVVKDAPGFAVNRFFVPFYVESVRLYEEGAANIPTIDEAAKRAFGIGMGAFELMNVTGIPIAVHAAGTLEREVGPFFAPPEALKRQMESRQLFDLSGPIDESKIPLVTDRLYGAALGVAGSLLDEKVASMEDTDRGAKIGLRWRQGPFELMNAIGIAKTFEVVSEAARRHPDFKMPGVIRAQYEKGTPFAFKYVDYSVKNGIGYITVNRPEAMNSLNEAVVDQLAQAFAGALKDQDARAIAFRGAGKTFVAGADIKYFIEKINAGKVPDIVAFTRGGHELLLKIENSPKLTIAVVDGLSLGGGSELSLACQAIVATKAGSFGFPETGIGIYPGLGGMIRFARIAGPELAKYYVFTGRSIKAEDAAKLGVVTVLAEPALLESAIEKLADSRKPDKYARRALPAEFEDAAAACKNGNADRLLRREAPVGVDAEFAERTRKAVRSKAPLALKAVNDLIDRQMKVGIPEAVEMELDGLTSMFGTQDALTGLLSVGGTPPEYQGK